MSVIQYTGILCLYYVYVLTDGCETGIDIVYLDYGSKD